jgi:hypothetical protein
MMLAVSTLVAAAFEGSRLKTDVAEFQSHPQYGHTVIARPVDLSLNEIDRDPHFVNPSAAPQTLLTVSKVCGLKVID